MVNTLESPLYFVRNYPDTTEYPIVVMKKDDLLAVWSREKQNYIGDILASGRYPTREAIEPKFENLLTTLRPMEMPAVFAGMRDGEISITYNDGRHRTRFLLDNCGVEQMPLQVHKDGAKLLLEKGLARKPTAKEQKGFDANLSMHARMVHTGALLRLEERGLPVDEINLVIGYQAYYKDQPFIENIMPLKRMVNHYQPFEAARERTREWQEIHPPKPQERKISGIAAMQMREPVSDAALKSVAQLFADIDTTRAK